MDRQIVWPAAIPLETDLLNTNLNTMVALGRLALDLMGSSTKAAGLPCTPTTPASMSVQFGAGAIYQLESIDSAPYSSVPANVTDQILKQGILLASANAQLTLTAPTTPGNSVIFLIEAAFEEIDAGDTVLAYYNSSNPTVPYAGPNNSGSTSKTVREGRINLQAKAGVAAPSPTAPTADAGFIPLYTVTVAYGQTVINSGNISVAAGAPFLSPSTYAPINSPAFTGTPTAPTPAAGDNSTKLATTAFVDAALGAGGLGGSAQAWHDLTSSRTSGTSYTNSTSAPIEVVVSFPDTSSATGTATVVVGGVTIVNNLLYDQGTSIGALTVTFTVPVGATYVVTAGGTGGSIATWCELR